MLGAMENTGLMVLAIKDLFLKVTTFADMEGEETFYPAFLGHADEVVEERISDDDIILVNGTKKSEELKSLLLWRSGRLEWSRYPSSLATSRVRSVSTANGEIGFIHGCFMPWW